MGLTAALVLCVGAAADGGVVASRALDTTASVDGGAPADAGSFIDAGAATDGGLPLTPAMELVRRTTPAELVTQLLEDGRFVRFGTAEQGPVHVWWPRTYRPATARVVIYVHGFYDNGDSAFLGHRLATQFRDSGLNALFIVPEAPSWRTDDVLWKELPALLEQVERRAKVTMPSGPVWVIAHSGAYRTTAQWLEHERLERIILLDGLYGADDDFRRWLETEPAKHKLLLIGFDTQQRIDWFLRRHPDAVRLDDLPYLYDGLTPAQRNARLLAITSERFAHMELVTEGKVVPFLLNALGK